MPFPFSFIFQYNEDTCSWECPFKYGSCSGSQVWNKDMCKCTDKKIVVRSDCNSYAISMSINKNQLRTLYSGPQKIHVVKINDKCLKKKYTFSMKFDFFEQHSVYACTSISMRNFMHFNFNRGMQKLIVIITLLKNQ